MSSPIGDNIHQGMATQQRVVRDRARNICAHTPLSNLHTVPLQSQIQARGQSWRCARWLYQCPTDYMWANVYDFDFVRHLLQQGLFFLDEGPGDDGRAFALIPNPIRRYVLPLDHYRWRKNKKVRRHARDFELSVNRDFKDAMIACKRWVMCAYVWCGCLCRESVRCEC